jgi:limonene-1,2-epoxide hydrolase
MPGEAEAVRIVGQLIAAFNRRDRSGVADLLADDVTVCGIPLAPAVGKKAAMVLLEPFLHAEEIDWEVLNMAANGSTVFNERIDRFRFAGRPWTEVRAAGVFEITADGLIAAWRDYFDLAELERAMGPDPKESALP